MKLRILWLALILAMFSFACDDKKPTEPAKTPETKTADAEKKTDKKAEDTKTAEAPKADEDEEDIEFSDTEVEAIAAEAAGEVNEANADKIIAELEKELAAELGE